PDFPAALAASSAEESRRRLTVVGPHRDDLSLLLNHRSAATFASEGQQRTLALALKLAQARLLLALHHHPPLLLLDDIFGELDPQRRNALLTSLPQNSQQFITTTHLDWATGSFSPQRLYTVHHGTLTAR
ncbi:MAG: DNA replication and repair protein RecF, partial [Verrucomicrobiales bacterium]